MKTPPLALLALGLALALLTGCLTSREPFYAESDIVADPRLAGAYVVDDGDDQYSWEVAEIPGQTGRYRVRLTEGHDWSEYLGTLFKLGDHTFLDLLPTTDANTHRYPDGPGTTSGLVRAVTHDPLHVVCRIEIGADAVTYRLVAGDDIKTLLEREPALKSHSNDDAGALVIDEPTDTLRALLLKHGGDDELFSSVVTLRRKSPE